MAPQLAPELLQEQVYGGLNPYVLSKYQFATEIILDEVRNLNQDNFEEKARPQTTVPPPPTLN